jgi:hypothetical protein
VRISSADQAKAAAALLRRSDLGMGWGGGQTQTSSLTPPDSPGFRPKESDLVVTGHADARFQFQQGVVELDQDVEVLASERAVRTDFSRSISPQLATCLAYQLKHISGVVSASVSRIQFPPLGSVSAVYRAELTVKTKHGVARAVIDYVFFGHGRVEYEFTVRAPAETRDQLGRFEVGLAQILLQRAEVAPA